MWTWGIDFDGALGLCTVCSTGPQRVQGPLAACIAANGGAVQAAAGLSFALVLTASGRAVVWGRVPGGPPAGGEAAATHSSAAGSLPTWLGQLLLGPESACSRGQHMRCAEVPLPARLTSVSCGAEHALLSDGHRVGHCCHLAASHTHTHTQWGYWYHVAASPPTHTHTLTTSATW